MIYTLRAKNPTKIHGALRQVCSEFTVDRSTVSRWVNRFRGGCVSIDNEWPKIRKAENQQMKEVWTLWQMHLKKVVVQHVKNFLEPREQTLQENAQ